MFYFLFSVFLLDFQCSDCVLTEFLAWSTVVFTVKVCWCWRLGIWNKLGKRILEAKVFVISWGCTQRKKSRLHQVFSYKSGDEPGGVGSQEKLDSLLVVLKTSAFRLGDNICWSWGMKWSNKCWEDVGGWREFCSWYSVVAPGTKLGLGSAGREERRSADGLAGFLEWIACVLAGDKNCLLTLGNRKYLRFEGGILGGCGQWEQ